MIIGKGKVTIIVESEVEFTMSGVNGDEVEFVKVVPNASSDCLIDFSSPVAMSKDAFSRLNAVIVDVCLKVVAKESVDKVAAFGIKPEVFVHQQLPKDPKAVH